MAHVPNTLYDGDNLDILRRYIDDESVDLVHLNPLFNSVKTQNIDNVQEENRKLDMLDPSRMNEASVLCER